jgi:gas vesicle protein
VPEEGTTTGPTALGLGGVFLVGAVAGAAAALLFAPSPGAQTRDAISTRVNELASRIRAARRQAQTSVEEIAAKAGVAGKWPPTVGEGVLSHSPENGGAV